MNMSVITLEDGIEYMFLDSVNYNNHDYFVLVDPNNGENFTVRKALVENNEEFLVKLDTEEEFNNVMALFNKKHRDKNAE